VTTCEGSHLFKDLSSFIYIYGVAGIKRNARHFAKNTAEVLFRAFSTSKHSALFFCLKANTKKNYGKVENPIGLP
jgi:hypothetical protein